MLNPSDYLEFKTVDEKFAAIISMLKEAHTISIHIEWRKRYNTNLPDQVQREELANPQQHARALWFASKALYSNNAEEIDLYVKTQNNLQENHKSLYLAMKKTIDKELQDTLEKQVLGGSMSKKKFEELEDIEDTIEMDEDELYVAETEEIFEESEDEETAEWEGDEFIGDPEDFEDDQY